MASMRCTTPEQLPFRLEANDPLCLHSSCVLGKMKETPLYAWGGSRVEFQGDARAVIFRTMFTAPWKSMGLISRKSQA